MREEPEGGYTVPNGHRPKGYRIVLFVFCLSFVDRVLFCVSLVFVTQLSFDSRRMGPDSSE